MQARRKLAAKGQLHRDPGSNRMIDDGRPDLTHRTGLYRDCWLANEGERAFVS